MSRVGKKIIKVVEGVKINVEGDTAIVSGPKGELKVILPKGIAVLVDGDQVKVSRVTETKEVKSLHGSVQRTLIACMSGVSSGWSKKLELVGTGYRAKLEGGSLVLAIGFSHPVRFDPPEEISFAVEENKIIVSGIDKRLVGQIAADIRAVRPPDSYKGKGIRYEGEKVRRKPGKAAKVGAA